MSDVVVDASLALKWLIEEEYSSEATELRRAWNAERTRIVAPSLLPYELTNALHRRVVRSQVALEHATSLLRLFLAMDIAYHDSPGLHGRALQVAGLLRQGASYDAHYLALAEEMDCELWTADRRFYQAVVPGARNVRWIGEFA